MRDSAYFLSWFIFHLVNVLVISIIVTIVNIWIMVHSNQFLFFLSMFLFGMAYFGIVLVYVAVFQEVKTSTPAFILGSFILYYLHYAIPESAPAVARTLTSFVPPLAIANWSLSAFTLEAQQLGITFDTMWQYSYQFNLGQYLLIQTANIVIWTLFGLYLQYTAPTEFGTQKSKLFCLDPKFWCRRDRR